MFEEASARASKCCLDDWNSLFSRYSSVILPSFCFGDSPSEARQQYSSDCPQANLSVNTGACQWQQATGKTGALKTKLSAVACAQHPSKIRIPVGWLQLRWEEAGHLKGWWPGGLNVRKQPGSGPALRDATSFWEFPPSCTLLASRSFQWGLTRSPRYCFLSPSPNAIRQIFASNWLLFICLKQMCAV